MSSEEMAEFFNRLRTYGEGFSFAPSGMDEYLDLIKRLKINENFRDVIECFADSVKGKHLGSNINIDDWQHYSDIILSLYQILQNHYAEQGQEVSHEQLNELLINATKEVILNDEILITRLNTIISDPLIKNFYGDVGLFKLAEYMMEGLLLGIPLEKLVPNNYKELIPSYELRTNLMNNFETLYPLPQESTNEFINELGRKRNPNSETPSGFENVA